MLTIEGRYIAGILINVVGFAGAVGTPVPQGATYVSSTPPHPFLRQVQHLPPNHEKQIPLQPQLLHRLPGLERGLLPPLPALPGPGDGGSVDGSGR